MITLTNSGSVRLNSGTCIDQSASDYELGIRAIVGYHNHASVNPKDAIEIIQDRLDALSMNYRAGICTSGTLPSRSVRVGQVRLRNSDPMYPLYVTPNAAE
jgi:hypothetical protein